MLVDAASPQDAPAIARIHVAAWQAAYRGIMAAEHLASLSVPRRQQYWQQAIAAGTPELLVARSGDALAGWIAFGACRDAGATPQDGEVWAFYVDPAHWSRGVGQALWRQACQRLAARGLRQACLWVLAENQRAIRFYRAAGWTPEPSSARQTTVGGQALQEIRFAAALAGDPACSTTSASASATSTPAKTST